MCNCKETNGFAERLAEAKRLTEETKEVHVVYVHKKVNLPFMRKEKDLTDALGICCYFLPDGTEIIYTKKEVVAKTKSTKNVSKKNNPKV